MGRSVPDWNIKVPTLSREIGVPTGTAHSADPSRTPTHQLVPSEGRERKKRAKITQKQHPSAAPGPFCQTGCPHLCSLYVVIRVFCCDFGYGKTRKSQRIASRDVGSLLAKKGLKLQRGVVFE